MMDYSQSTTLENSSLLIHSFLVDVDVEPLGSLSLPLPLAALATLAALGSLDILQVLLDVVVLSFDKSLLQEVFNVNVESPASLSLSLSLLAALATLGPLHLVQPFVVLDVATVRAMALVGVVGDLLSAVLGFVLGLVQRIGAFAGLVLNLFQSVVVRGVLVREGQSSCAV
jgi:hypothetical protein